MSSVPTTEFLPELSALIAPRGRIRPLTEEDLDQIALLWRSAARPVSIDFVRRVFFDLPWRDESLSSLGYEDISGRLIACLGIMPRPMVFRGRVIRAAVGHHFIVEQSRRGVRAGIAVARRFVEGPQDLSLAAGNDFGHRIWTFLGGSASSLHSFSWTRTLRPARHALHFLMDRGLPASAAATLNPACQAVDATLNLFGQSAFPLKAPSALSDDLDPVTMLACLTAFANNRALRPFYDVASLTWLLETLAKATDRGHLHKVAVRTHSGRTLGWYLYYLGQSEVAEVLQVGGQEESLREVLHHLFYHARQRGALAVTGPVDARLLVPLTEDQCVFHGPGNSWTLIHPRDPRIGDAIHAGDAFLSRLEGAQWVESDSRKRR